MYNNVFKSDFVNCFKRVTGPFENYFKSIIGTLAECKNVSVPLIGLKVVHDERCEFLCVRNPAGNRFSFLVAILDERNEIGMFRGTPLVTGFHFLLKNHRYKK
jgi:hypothetical protein